MVYFDKDIREGVTYKYWVSAWDSWNNESAWSQSVTCAVPADTEPDLPSSLNISMLVRELPDRSLLPPGLVDEGPVTMENLKADASKPMRSIPGVDTSTVSLADRLGVTIGKFLNGTSLPLTIDQPSEICPTSVIFTCWLPYAVKMCFRTVQRGLNGLHTAEKAWPAMLFIGPCLSQSLLMRCSR